MGETSYSNEEDSRAALRPSITDANSSLAAAGSTRKLASPLLPVGVQSDAKFSWMGHRPLGADVVARLDGDDDSGGFLRSRALNTTSKNDVGLTSSSLSRAAAAMALGPHRLEKQGADRSLLLPSSREQRARVATALDRMGGGVIEVREAFQRWVPGTRRTPDIGPKHIQPDHKERQARSGGGPSVSAKSLVGSGKRGDNTSDSAKITIPGATTGVVDLNGGILRAMQELRIPLETAEAFCKETAGEVDAVPVEEISFSNFVSRYADATGLLTESSARNREGKEVWVEGPGGRWVAVSRKGSEGARRIFDKQAARQEQETKSDDGGELCVCNKHGSV